MKIPFLDRFKKESAHSKQTGSGKRQTPKLSPLSKPEGDKLSKTVMPNVTRSVSTMQEMPHIDGPSLSEGSFEVPSTTPRPITLGPRKTPERDKDLPPAVALALEPRVERAVSLDIADVIGQMPAGLTKPLESIDKSLRILIKASDLEKDMSNAKPKVALTSLYSQAPDIFLKPVPTSDTTEINLPFDKVLEAFMHMQVRRDQVSGEEVPQVETPFLQVTLEDSERFGVPNEPLPASGKPSAAGANATAEENQKFTPIPATAAAIAAASPEAAAAVTERAVRPVLEVQPEKPLRISLTAPSTGSSGKGGSDRPSKAAPDRIPFHLPPKETGAPAPERVPASSGPPVSSGTVTRARVPFEMPPAETEFSADSHIDEAGGEQKISLALKPILLSLPVFELSGDPKEVPEDSRIEFSFSLVQSQLATGRIAVPAELFERALPPDGRRFFSAKNLQMPVLLPLQEVLKNLPSDALRMRDDQEEREAGETIETPFSTAAAEDAQRLKKSPHAVQPELTPLPVEVAGTASAMDAKAVIARANALPGLRACALSFTDGLNLAGNLPAETGADALCAIAPALWERIENHLGNTGIGEMNALTLHCTKSTITFFRHANICMAALHENGEITDKVRAELGQMLTELSQTYSPTKG